MAELDEGQDAKETLYYEGAAEEALKKWRAMSEAERNALKKGDEIDAENTTDLEKSDEEIMDEIPYEFFENNRINMARAFLGYDGGYSVRKLKKFMRQARLAEQEAKEEQKKYYDAKKAGGAEAADAQGEEGEGQAEVPYSDESDIDEALNVMDEETF